MAWRRSSSQVTHIFMWLSFELNCRTGRRNDLWHRLLGSVWPHFTIFEQQTCIQFIDLFLTSWVRNLEVRASQEYWQTCQTWKSHLTSCILRSVLRECPWKSLLWSSGAADNLLDDVVWELKACHADLCVFSLMCSSAAVVKWCDLDQQEGEPQMVCSALSANTDSLTYTYTHLHTLL